MNSFSRHWCYRRYLKGKGVKKNEGETKLFLLLRGKHSNCHFFSFERAKQNSPGFRGLAISELIVPIARNYLTNRCSIRPGRPIFRVPLRLPARNLEIFSDSRLHSTVHNARNGGNVQRRQAERKHGKVLRKRRFLCEQFCLLSLS